MTRPATPSPARAPHADVVVIGGANVDHKCQTLATAVAGTSNPGRSRMSAGGVARNVAENLSRLGVRVALVTAVGDDAAGEWLIGETESSGAIVRCAVVPGIPTGTYTAVLDQDGEMIIAVAAMEAVEHITAELMDSAREQIARARFVVLDANVPVPGLLRAGSIARERAVPIVADPVSVAKAGGIARLISAGIQIHTITPNVSELAALTGGGSSDEEIRAAAARLHAAGVENVWVTLGALGSLFSSTRDGRISAEHLAPLRASVVDATGAGDAMLAAYVAGLLHGLEPHIAAATYGRAAAAITVESRHTVNPAIHLESLTARIRDDTASRGRPDE